MSEEKVPRYAFKQDGETPEPGLSKREHYACEIFSSFMMNMNVSPMTIDQKDSDYLLGLAVKLANELGMKLR